MEAARQRTLAEAKRFLADYSDYVLIVLLFIAFGIIIFLMVKSG